MGEVSKETKSSYRFQMVSLLKLAKVTEEGVRFLSPHDGKPMFVQTSVNAPQVL